MCTARFDEPDFAKGDGLLPAVAQDARTGEVLMLAWMDLAAYRETLETGRAVYFSRSRQQRWRKGDESGHIQRVLEVRLDCDRDAILLKVDQTGVACHTGARSCFFRSVPLATDSTGNAKGTNTMTAEQQLESLQLELPPAPKPMGVYKPLVISGNMAYVSGHGPLLPDGTLMEGRVGADVDQEFGYQAARQTGLAILATLREGLGSLDKVVRLVKLLGMVNCESDFRNHPAVINGCSELFAEVFGEECGVAARSAVGMGSLPGNIPVEIEAIFEVAVD